MPRLDLRGPENIIRVCALAAEIPYGQQWPGSIIKQCAECDEPIWYNPSQTAPNHPETGEPVVETHILCSPCFLVHHALEDAAPTLLVATDPAPTENERESEF